MDEPLPTTTTQAVRAWRALNRAPDKRWVDWATDLLAAGTDTPSLRILAGLGSSFDRQDVPRRLDNVLAELGLPVTDPAQAIEDYTTELVKVLVEGRQAMPLVLRELAQICIDTDYDRSLYQFYLLHYARDDLAVREFQMYWEGANRANIDSIVREEAKRWLQERERAA